MEISINSLRGSAQLVFDCIAGVTGSVERMHETIARRPLPFSPRPSGPTRAHGLTASVVYSTIQKVNAGLAFGIDRSMNLVSPEPPGSIHGSESRWVAALNGVCGDHLEATANPLAITMTMMTPETPVDLNTDSLSGAFPEAGPNILNMIHGLGMSEKSWFRSGISGLGTRLRDELGYSTLYLRYNTGRHISTNGQELAGMLEALCNTWLVPVESISLVGHSMGGLVIRSACWYAGNSNAKWLGQLRRVLFLGTPHHGSPLEKAGYIFEKAMQTVQYVEPLLFGRKRSAGIKDLRFGNLLDEDWQGLDQNRLNPDSRRAVPLLPDVDYYFSAATVDSDEHGLKGRLMGDMLVRLGSAVGSHPDELRRLNVRPENCRIFPEKNHFDLLDDGRVHQQVIEWFGR